MPQEENSVIKKNKLLNDTNSAANAATDKGDDHEDYKDSKKQISITGDKRKSLEKGATPPKKSFSIKLNTSAKPISKKDEPSVKKIPKLSVFNEESDSEEEMPIECRMKMRNIGRDTITSAGPNSYNKGKQGFTDHSFKKF